MCMSQDENDILFKKIRRSWVSLSFHLIQYVVHHKSVFMLSQFLRSSNGRVSCIEFACTVLSPVEIFSGDALQEYSIFPEIR